MTGDARPRRFPARLPGAGSPGSAPAHGRDVLRPQRPVHEAAQDARRSLAATGLGLDSAPVRRRMVERLRADGVRSEPVLAAMMLVERHRFVDSALAVQAYEDTSLPIGLGQTISKPSVVARMLEWLMLGGRARQQGHLGRVLEVGTGCGYQTAVLAQLSRSVVSIERLWGLHEAALRNLGEALPVPCRLLHGDGMLGSRDHGPFDTIVAAAGGAELPQAWLDQLSVGGRLVAPVVHAGGQVLVVVDRVKEGWQRTVGESVQFVPLKSGLA